MLKFAPTADPVRLIITATVPPATAPRVAIPKLGIDLALTPLWAGDGGGPVGLVADDAAVGRVPVDDVDEQLIELAGAPAAFTGPAASAWVVRAGGLAWPVTPTHYSTDPATVTVAGDGATDLRAGDWVQWTRFYADAELADIDAAGHPGPGLYGAQITYRTYDGEQQVDTATIKVLEAGAIPWAPGVTAAMVRGEHRRLADVMGEGQAWADPLRAASRWALKRVRAWGRRQLPQLDEDNVMGGAAFADPIITRVAYHIGRDLGWVEDDLEEYRRESEAAMTAALDAFVIDTDADGEGEAVSASTPGGAPRAPRRDQGVNFRPAAGRRGEGPQAGGTAYAWQPQRGRR